MDTKEDVYRRLVRCCTNDDVINFKKIFDAHTIDVEHFCDNGMTLLGIATVYENIEIIDFLLNNGSSVRTTDRTGNNPIEQAIGFRLLSTLKLLIEKEDNIDTTNNAFFTACCEEDDTTKEIMEFLLSKGADINYECPGMRQHTPLLACIESHSSENMKFLLEKGADVNKADIRGNTPLIEAVRNDFRDMAMTLLDEGADIDKSNIKGNTPLIISTIGGNWVNLDIVKFLLTRGTNIYHENKKGNNFLYYLNWKNRQKIKSFVEKNIQGDAIKPAKPNS